MHYARLKRRGSVEPEPRKAPSGEPPRFIEAALASDTDDCILWPFAGGAGGYGSTRIDGRTRTPHTVVCLRAHGPKPHPKHEAAHSCGQRLCINPRHLRWASRSENQLERAAHGTSNQGERQWQSRLTADQVREIKARLYGEWGEQSKIADEFGVGKKTVSDIATGKTWAWLPP